MSLLPCPECGLPLPDDSDPDLTQAERHSRLMAQVVHVERYHPDLIERRLKEANLWDYSNNRPEYVRPGDPWDRPQNRKEKPNEV